ncbi:hypothetical protein PFZ55_41645 [Streptomyces sp. MS2A]|nr:hypothetical protein [Streptomyces sp. MS2A]
MTARLGRMFLTGIASGAILATVTLFASNSANAEELATAAASSLEEESFGQNVDAAHIAITSAPPTGQVLAMTRTPTGELIPLGEYALDLNGPAQPNGNTNETATPYLIDFNQWVSCFSLNNEGEVFASYSHPYNGGRQDVRLKCGNSTWGYKHIRLNHEADWQEKYNTARDRGWNPELQGMNGWDDLMAEGAGNAIRFWTYAGPVSNNTKCTVGELVFVEWNGSTWTIVYEFRAVAAFATNSDKLISTYPTRHATC